MNTTLCYIQSNGRYLMLHRTKKAGDYNRDKWIGIGGKFEPGESPQDCVIREVREETGLVLDPGHLEYRGIVTFVDIQGGEASPSATMTAAFTPTPSAGDTPATPPCAIAYTEYMHVFRARQFGGTLRTDCDEGDLQWVPITAMNDLPHWKGDEIFLDFLAQEKPFFSLKLVYQSGILRATYLDGMPYDHFGPSRQNYLL